MIYVLIEAHITYQIPEPPPKFSIFWAPKISKPTPSNYFTNKNSTSHLKPS